MSTTIAVTTQINAPVKLVWDAMTDVTIMKKWFFDLDEFKPEKGFVFEFYGGAYLHRCTILDVNPEKKLVFEWIYPLYKGRSVVQFHLDTIDEATTEVTLLHNGVETFPADDPNFSIASFNAGWDEIMNLGLKKYFENEG